MTLTGLRDFGGRWFVPVAVALIVVMTLGVFKAKSDAAAARRRIADLERKVDAARDQAHGLAAEVQYLENPKRIEALARRELGMAPAGRAQKKSAADLPPLGSAPPEEAAP